MTAIKMYHGTTEENSRLIVRDGFQPYTCFAHHLEETVVMGGEWVFEVLFDRKPTDHWEYISRDPIGPERIISLVHYRPTVVFENLDTKRDFMRNGFMKEVWDDGVDICGACDGRGQVEYHPKFTRWRDNLPVTPCPECRGCGAVVVSGNPDILYHQRM